MTANHLHALPVPTDDVPAFREELYQRYGLTQRQQEICELLLTGRNAGEIAETVFLTHHTVSNHLTDINHKLGTQGQAQIILVLLDQIPARREVAS